MSPITKTSLTSLNLLTTATIAATSTSLTTTSPTTHPLGARDSNSINSTPLIIIPLLCTAIFALIIIYTIRQEREYQNDVTQGRRPARSVSSWESTGAWVREVRVANSRSARVKKGKTGGRRGSRSVGSGVGEEQGEIGSSASGGVSEWENRGKEGVRRLSTVEEESEVEGRAVGRSEIESVGGKRGDAEVMSEEAPRRSSRRERGRVGAGKGQLKGGRRPSSTIRKV